MKQYLIIGAGRFGASVAYNLYKKGNEVMIVDKSEEAINNIMDDVTTALIGNANDEKFIASLGVRNFDVVVVAFGSEIASSILVSTLVKEAGAKYVISKSMSEVQGKVLKKIGVDRIVFPERDMGKRVADSLSSSNILEHIELSSEYGILEFKAKEEWYGKTINDINLRREYGWNVIAIKENGNLNVNPIADTIINKADTIIALGKTKGIKKL